MNSRRDKSNRPLADDAVTPAHDPGRQPSRLDWQPGESLAHLRGRNEPFNQPTGFARHAKNKLPLAKLDARVFFPTLDRRRQA